MPLNPLPQLAGGLFLCDGGLETSLIYLDGLDLPQFASFVLLHDAAGRESLRRYFEPYLEICAGTRGAGFLLDTATWRASADWGQTLGYDAQALVQANHDAVSLARAIRDDWQTRIAGPIVISGVIGPRGDGYVVDAAGGVEDAMTFHLPQATALRDAGADMLSAVTMTSVAEAIGVAWAARSVGLPVAISFTVETDGRLPSGEPLREAVERVDAEASPDYFGVNCAHPSHFDACFEEAGAWTGRIRSIRANASARSHAELDAATELDIGDLPDLADRYVRLRTRLPSLNVLGGCCGTDHRHLRAIRDAWNR
ncbi:MAG: homocysteine S-methyltransferase family protein [Burkholderiales bacterium]